MTSAPQTTPADAPELLTERRGHVLLMGLNRPAKRNAMTVSLFQDLALAYGRLHRDPELRVGVLYGMGPAFTGGLDLTQWAPVFGAGRWPAIPEGGIDPFGLDEASRCAKPVVVAAHGVCFTVAIELMLAAEVRVAATDCRFGQIEVARGFYPCGGATVRLAQEVGFGNAARIILGGAEFSGADAHRMGLVQELVAPGEQFETALAIAEGIAAQAPLGVQEALRLMRVARVAGQEEGLKAMLPPLVPIMQTADAREAVKAFGEKRRPVFTGH